MVYDSNIIVYNRINNLTRFFKPYNSDSHCVRACFFCFITKSI